MMGVQRFDKEVETSNIKSKVPRKEISGVFYWNTVVTRNEAASDTLNILKRAALG